jgi:hypothetical protein
MHKQLWLGILRKERSCRKEKNAKWLSGEYMRMCWITLNQERVKRTIMNLQHLFAIICFY